MKPARLPRRRVRGFTLVESMVVVAIVGVLSSIALPSMEGHVLRARRSDALVSLMRAQLAEERWLANSAAFGSLAEIGVAERSSAGHYTLELAAAPGGYRITATATGAQTRDRACRVLRVQMAGGDLTFASGSDAEVANDAGPNRACWNR
ncbi:type IV pilin protein [Piscinibacter koreensis]|uniref:Prepilin-type N-terminal cleavage/methylation domain-containing protein n=1 Tax=Piscinibacter koreensis TaxID=2742824 RepID=A0A7Y6NQ22_9BURK|nr:type IV pilin protein [Schlegelella koreensis]NUZ07224.1 prepilin-type N-terminal cleavage/methylation domain-containing protein [Schlegelella koreensis]